MSLSIDLKILELQGAGGTAPRGTAASSGDVSFAQVLNLPFVFWVMAMGEREAGMSDKKI